MNSTETQPLSNLGQWALHYAQLGLAVFPLSPKSKVPLKGSRGFKDATKNIEEIRRLWTINPDANIGIATGAVSRIIVVDIDGDAGLQSFRELQKQLEPFPATVQVQTPGKIIDGTHSGIGLHLYYLKPDGVSINSAVGVAANIDVRGDNGYIVAAGSEHPNGGFYQFIPGVALGEIPFAVLPAPLVDFFVNATTKKTSPINPVADPNMPLTQAPTNMGSAALDDNLLKRIIAYLDTCAPAVQGQNGHSALLVVANSLVHGFGLEPDTAARIAWQHYNPKCQPPWGDAEWNDFYRKFTEARDKPPNKPFGWLLNNDASTTQVSVPVAQNWPIIPTLTQAGQIDPESGRMVLNIHRTKPTAEAFIRTFYCVDGFQTLRYSGGFFFGWKDNAYRLIDEDCLRAQLLDFLDAAVTQSVSKEKVVSGPFPARKPNVDFAMDALKSVAYMETGLPVPCWLGDGPAPASDPSMILFGKTQNLDLTTMQTIESSPKWFNYSAIDVDYAENHEGSIPSCPTWDNFLFQLFGDDVESKQVLLQYIGLLLTSVTKFQKALFIVGPKRAGKGTIGHVVRELVGGHNFCGPTTEALASHFGLQHLIGKTVAVISDARFSGQNLSILTERILTITGEDILTIDRKYHAPSTVRLPTRFLFFSNELPRLTDSGGALAGRFIVLKLTRSFFGKEDIDLKNKLLPELPGILAQAVAALQDLLKQGHFIQPESARDEVRLLENLTSPIANFVSERCNVGESAADAWTSTDELFGAWKLWCESEGYPGVGTKSTFSRNLTAALPELVQKRSNDFPNRPRGYTGISLKSLAPGDFYPH